MKLEKNARVAVIGGGPAGSFFSYFLIKIANRLHLDLQVDVYEPQIFSKQGPVGCNHCGGIISETLVQMLASEGINLPTKVVQRGIDSYTLHMDVGSTRIETPVHEKRIAAIHRGGGPKGTKELIWESFDLFLQNLTIQTGVNLIQERVKSISYEKDYPVIKTAKGNEKLYDLVVGTVGVNTTGYKLFEAAGIGYEAPKLTKTFICEFNLGADTIKKYFGSSMHVFLVDIPRLKFAAIIPKGNFATMVMLGSDIDLELVQAFMNDPAVKNCFPPELDLTTAYSCKCFPRINTQRAIQPFADRVVLLGDCAVSRLYKDGIGAAYSTAKAAAATAVLQGISKEDFKKHYWPACKAIHQDNSLGKIIFGLTKLIQINLNIRKAILQQVQKEQEEKYSVSSLSTILWDTFTGSATYTNIVKRALKPKLIVSIIYEFIMGLFNIKQKRKTSVISLDKSELGKIYKDGEIIVNQGDDGDCMYVIQEGEVEIFKNKNNTVISLAKLHDGDFFGEMALFEHELRSASVKAIGKVRVLTVDKKTLLGRIQKDPSMTFRILQKMSSRIRELNKQHAHVKTKQVA